MFYALIGSVVLASIGLALYALINKGELVDQISSLQRALQEQDASHKAEIDVWKSKFERIEIEAKESRKRGSQEAFLVSRLSALQEEFQEQDASHTAEIGGLKAELARLDKIRHIPNIIARSKRLEAEIASKLEQAQKEADEIVLVAHRDVEKMKARIATRAEEARQTASEIVRAAREEADRLKQRICRETERDGAKAKEARRVAELQASQLVEEAQKKAREIATQARNEAKEKTQKVDDSLAKATAYALQIREKAEARAHAIGGEAYQALKQYEFYEAAAKAMQNVISNYGDTYLVPPSHVLDELAEEYGFHKAGERLKIARGRTRIMEKTGVAATCNYPEGWKREYAINFVLGAFNGKVDSILARLKPANQGKLIQEIKDVYALANHNGEVFKNARIHEEFLDARLEELKWAVAVQRVKEKEREEQRAMREQIREEEKARKEEERAIKQAAREKDFLNEAIARVRLEYDRAKAEDREEFETQLHDLTEKLMEAEEKNRRAISNAQLRKNGHIYVISNVGSFGEDIYKIGMTRRNNPLERVIELGDASVPFPFDVHAMIDSENAPALEAAIHRRFLQYQVNKVNRRKEFFRLKLQDIRSVIDELKIDVKWTMAADAKDYRETLAMERRMQEDPGFRKQWEESEAAYESRHPFDDDEAESAQEDEKFSLSVEPSRTPLAGGKLRTKAAEAGG